MNVIQNDLNERPLPPIWRLHLMRLFFFLNFIGLSFDNWKMVIFPSENMEIMEGVAVSLYAAFSLLNLIGVRFPLKMIPILLIQLLYKGCWIFSTYIPVMSSGNLEAAYQEFFWICIAGIILNLIILPWIYIFQEYIKQFFRFQWKL